MEIGDVLEVRVAGTEIVDDEKDAGAVADLREDRLAELEVRQRDALGDLEVDVACVLVDLIVRANDPVLPLSSAGWMLRNSG